MTDRDSPTSLAWLDRRITLQQLGLAWERLWPALHWPLLVLGLGLIAVASGLFQHLDDQGRIGIIAIVVLLFLVSLKPLLRIARPSRLSAMRRMELAANIEHRALSSIADRQAQELTSPDFDVLWEEHQRRQLAKLAHVPISPPQSAWRRFDPVALRVPVALGVLVSLLLGPGDLTTNLRAAVRLAPAVAGQPLSIDAWLKPPAYTGKTPLLLSSAAIAEKIARGEDIQVPDNSVFTLRIAGAVAPSVQFVASDEEGMPAPELPEFAKVAKVAAGTLTAETKLTRPVTIVLRDGETDLARYPIITVPDIAPEITVTNRPHSEGRGTLVIDWRAKDDYGVKSISGELVLADEQADGLGFDSNGIFLFDPPQLRLALRRPNAKDEKGSSINDLASHPWAGLRVVLTLKAKDGAGQEGASSDSTFALPEREFTKPLARALIEQRKRLIHYPEKAPDAAALLDAILTYPASLIERSGHIVSIATVTSRLRNATGYDDVKLAIEGLWEIAVAIEEGSLADARAELQALRQELEKALQDGAPPERIAELMDKMRKAMDRFLDAMREETERRRRDGSLSENRGQKGRTISKEDLQKMLDALEELAQGGAKELAQKLLSELDRLLQNLQPGESDQAGGEGDQQLSDMLDQLGQMMQRQQGLMDETQRLPDPMGENGLGGEFGEQGEEGNRGRGGGELADRQNALRDMLEQMLRDFRGNSPGELGDAARSMEGAERALRDGNRSDALREQGEALDKMRKGAGRMAERLRENGQGDTENQARDGEGRGGDDDPLGRPRATRNPDTGPDENMVPSELAIRRAREILETLRSRANEQGLSDTERSYIDRLLRGLF